MPGVALEEIGRRIGRAAGLRVPVDRERPVAGGDERQATRKLDAHGCRTGQVELDPLRARQKLGFHDRRAQGAQPATGGADPVARIRIGRVRVLTTVKVWAEASAASSAIGGGAGGVAWAAAIAWTSTTSTQPSALTSRWTARSR